MKTATALAIEKRNLAHIEKINNPDNVLGLFRTDRNWLLPGDFEEVVDMVEGTEEVTEAENKPVSPFLKGMVAGMVLSLLVSVVTYLVVLL